MKKVNKLDKYCEDIKEKLGEFDSWEVISGNIIIKNTDISVFKNKGSGIPRGIRWFWKVEDIKYGNKVYITIRYNLNEYKCYIEIDKVNRTRIKWKSERFPNY